MQRCLHASKYTSHATIAHLHRSQTRSMHAMRHYAQSVVLMLIIFIYVILSPGAMALAATGSVQLAEQVSAASGAEMRLAGINWA